ncbi:MAG: M61 family metallopeptidase [Planctomycetes bacterium]|nr:M61 family metallopeptidase [Planctomycetota bacterium]
MSRILNGIVMLLTLFLAVIQEAAAQQPTAGTIEINLDATETPRRLIRTQMVIPVQPGPLTLYYPKWIQGEHAPNGPINDLSGLKLQANGKPITWKRDDLDLYAFHCIVPDGAKTLEVNLEFLAPTGDISAKLAFLNWHHVLVYPKGTPVYDLQVRANIKVPQGWKLGTSLPLEWNKDNVAQSKTVPLYTLIDSPILCGAHLREIPIGPKDGPPHYLVIACDSPAGLEISEAVKSQYDHLVEQAGELFGARHYRGYRFLCACSDHVGQGAVEHHESSRNHLPERFFVDDSYRKSVGVWVLPHEYVHSWCGKYRRPEGLATDDYQKPYKTRDLWVYEGLTEYLGFVLTGRAGMYTSAQSREQFASIADWAKLQGGRTWRPLEDTTVAAPHLYHARNDWSSRRRGVDFYDEGALLWLDADTLIREKTKGLKSLDDFCQGFFGGKSGPPEVKAYSYGDIIQSLNDVVAHDWKAFLDKRLTSTDPEPPLDGIARGGWKLVYRPMAGDLLKTSESLEKSLYLSSSIGLSINSDGQVNDVTPGRAADKAGIGPGMKLLAVNGRRYSPERLHAAVAATAMDKEKLALLLENRDYYDTFVLNYTDGARFPHLERDGAMVDWFTEIFSARKPAR